MEEKNRQNPFWNVKLPIEERLDWLLANMTLEEKITCMASTMPELPRFGIDMSYVGGEAAHGVEARNDQNGRNIPEPTPSFPQPGYRAYKEGGRSHWNRGKSTVASSSGWWTKPLGTDC